MSVNFDAIRPVATRYAEAATKAERAAARLADHADVHVIFDRYAALVADKGGKSHGVAPVVAREVLGFDESVTATPDENGKVSAKGTRVASLARWIQRNLPKDETDAPKPVVLRATLSGEGGGTVVVDPEQNPDLYAALVALIRGE